MTDIIRIEPTRWCAECRQPVPAELPAGSEWRVRWTNGEMRMWHAECYDRALEEIL